jgi:predicted Zn-dependent protease with MMP-like domain
MGVSVESMEEAFEEASSKMPDSIKHHLENVFTQVIDEVKSKELIEF